MAEQNVDQVAAIKAGLELMVSENTEIHDYFRDLLGKVSELEAQEPEARREKFKDLVSMGAFRFNGVDIRHFTRTSRRPLPPPLFLSRTQRRLKNTLTLVNEFAQRGLFEDAEQLRSELDLLSSTIINESSGKEVKGFKAQVDELRESSLFQSYQETKERFIRQDPELRADAEFISAKESVEDGEELMRQRADDLDALSKDIESGTMDLDDAQARLDAMSLDNPLSAPLTDDVGSGADPNALEIDDDDFADLGGDLGGTSGDEFDSLIDGSEDSEP